MPVAVICEFNPFHNGHEYLLKKAKSLSGEPVLAIMSGSFTQRGEAACATKFERAEIALRHGADMVVELPAAYAVANAQRFAQGGIAIAKAFRADYLAFGCENDALSLLKDAAGALKNPAVNKIIAEKMSGGAYYPRALEEAVREVCGEKTALVLTSPNNILAVEYLRAIGDSAIKPLPVKRKGAAHDSLEAAEGFASASKIRELLKNGESAADFLPEAPKSIADSSRLETAYLYRLRCMSAADFALLPDVSEGLENRISDAVRNNNSLEEIISAVKTKRYTHARIRRILTCALLGITEELQRREIDCARVLGFTKDGEKLLKNCELTPVTSVSKALKSEAVNSDLLKKDILACDLQALAFSPPKPCALDYLTKIITQNSAI